MERAAALSFKIILRRGNKKGKRGGGADAAQLFSRRTATPGITGKTLSPPQDAPQKNTARNMLASAYRKRFAGYCTAGVPLLTVYSNFLHKSLTMRWYL